MYLEDGEMDLWMESRDMKYTPLCTKFVKTCTKTVMRYSKEKKHVYYAHNLIITSDFIVNVRDEKNFVEVFKTTQPAFGNVAP